MPLKNGRTRDLGSNLALDGYRPERYILRPCILEGPGGVGGLCVPDAARSHPVQNVSPQARQERVFVTNQVDLARLQWRGHWIWQQAEDNTRFSVCYFRRSFDLDEADGATFTVHMTADSRYRLYVNGTQAGRGPCRGDLEHYNFETYDLGHLLRKGKNVLAVQVLAYSSFGPVAEMHAPEGALAVNAQVSWPDGRNLEVDTDEQWRLLPDAAYGREQYHGHSYYCVNPMEVVDGAKLPWGWTEPDFDDSSWQSPRLMPKPFSRSSNGHPRHRWRLVPRAIPHLPETPVPVQGVRAGQHSLQLRQLLDDGQPLTIPANQTVEFTLFMAKLFTGYPSMRVSGGTGSEVRLYYAEATQQGDTKGHRDDLDWGEVPELLWDTYLPGGRQGESWEPIHWRCARFIKLSIRTGSEPLSLDELTFRFTSYPFQQAGRFTSDDPQLAAIWDISWHTALCCAHEHYEDCPYYEQLQYIGDTRLQAIISYYVAGDATLARQTLRQFDQSRMTDGITQSRYPTNLTQIIPPFSLYYLMMIEDYYLYYGDVEMVEELEQSIHGVARWFLQKIGPNGLLGRTPWWNFVDWAPEFFEGVPPEADQGGSTVINLQLVGGLQTAARLLDVLGDAYHRDQYQTAANAIQAAVRKLCWKPAEGLFADGPDSSNFSQHSNMWAILTGTADEAQTQQIISRLTSDKTLIQASYYFKYYLYQALQKAAAWPQLETVLEPWREMIKMGFSTFPEKPEPVRSDCHAWSAWPMFELQRVVLGARPTSPGWASAEVAPQPMSTTSWARGLVPTPRGTISIAWRCDTCDAGGPRPMGVRIEAPAGMSVAVTLPDGTSKTFADGGAITLGRPDLIPPPEVEAAP